MKDKITATSLIKLTKNILVDNIIPNISSTQINEFKIGKNLFYEVTDDKLKYIQRIINIVFQKIIPINNASVAFRKNLSYLHLFEPHRKNYYFLRLDITSFFHSISIDDVKMVLEDYFDTKNKFIYKNKKQAIVDGFINLISYKIPKNSTNAKFKNKEIIPMGFITSPVISNIIFRQIDIQIQKFCSQRNITYTRYADDMLFSSGKNSKFVHSDTFEKEISILVGQKGFKLNQKKTIRKEHTISLNGYTIQHSKYKENTLGLREKILINEFRLSNKKINIISKLIYMVEIQNQNPKYILKKLFNYALPLDIPRDKQAQYEQDQLKNKFSGYRSYLLSFIQFNKKYNILQDDTKKKYSFIIDKLSTQIDRLL